MLGCIDIKIVLLCLEVQRFGMPCSPPHCVIVCACVLLGIIGIQPSKVSVTLALADAEVKVFAGDVSWLLLPQLWNVHAALAHQYGRIPLHVVARFASSWYGEACGTKCPLAGFCCGTS